MGTLGVEDVFSPTVVGLSQYETDRVMALI